MADLTSGNRHVVFFRVCYPKELDAKAVDTLINALYSALHEHRNAVAKRTHILTSPYGAGLLCNSIESALHVACLVVNAMGNNVAAGLDYGHVQTERSQSGDNLVRLEVGASINIAARLSFMEGREGRIMASPNFLNELRRYDARYAALASDVIIDGIVKDRAWPYHILEPAPLLNLLTTPQGDDGSGSTQPKPRLHPAQASHVLVLDIAGFTKLPEYSMGAKATLLWRIIWQAFENLSLSDQVPPYVTAGDGVAFVSPETETDDSKGTRRIVPSALYICAKEIMRLARREKLPLHASLDYGPVVRIDVGDGRTMFLGPPIIDADDASHSIGTESIALTERYLRTLNPLFQEQLKNQGTLLPAPNTNIYSIPLEPPLFTLKRILEILDHHRPERVWVLSESLLILRGTEKEQRAMADEIVDRMAKFEERHYTYLQLPEKRSDLERCMALFRQTIEAHTRIREKDEVFSRLTFALVRDCATDCAFRAMVEATSPHLVFWRSTTGETWGAMTATTGREGNTEAGWLFLRPEGSGRLIQWLEARQRNIERLPNTHFMQKHSSVAGTPLPGK